uniref:Cell migration inducing hyaluronidase 1 n=1 Tax=Salmo trutta TaxID=8032 RepID=A0A674EN28_SALTR
PLSLSLSQFQFKVRSVCVMTLTLLVYPTVCPDREPGLQPWTPGHSEAHHVTIGYGRKVILTSSATVHSIEILNGGKLVIADSYRPILLRTKHILIGNRGQLHIGSPDCPYKGNLTISLFGRSDDTDAEHSYFGRKYIGVGTGGTLEIHGQKKLSWTFLNKTLHPGESEDNSYLFERGWGNRGIIVHVIDPKTGEVLHNDRFDTYRSKEESRRLAQYVDVVDNGMILAMVVNDEGSNNLEDSARKILTKLGSKDFHRLGFRHPWSFIALKGNASSAVEDHAIYQGEPLSHLSLLSLPSSLLIFPSTSPSQCLSFSPFHPPPSLPLLLSISYFLDVCITEAEWTEWFDRDDERGSGDWEKLSDLHKAYPDRLCSTPMDIQAESHDGVPSNETGDVIYKSDRDYGFVCLNKDQSHGLCHNYRVRFLCGKLVRPQASISIERLSNSTVLELAEPAEGWGPGDKLVLASTDYSMHQAEEFTILPCTACGPTQVKVQGKPVFLHMGEEVDGVDMRAEVGLLSRNILVRGEMEPGCYGNEACKFFAFDTFGGHVKVERGFKSVQVSGVELQHMGQQSMGHYPVHFHMNGDVDQKGGYDPPTSVSDLSIHHTFSRCVTVHGSNGLLVKDVVGYDALGHCFFTEDGPEERNTFDHCLGLMIRAGTLLPSDRDSKMCRDITQGAFPGYVANPRQDCSKVLQICCFPHISSPPSLSIYSLFPHIFSHRHSTITLSPPSLFPNSTVFILSSHLSSPLSLSPDSSPLLSSPHLSSPLLSIPLLSSTTLLSLLICHKQGLTGRHAALSHLHDTHLSSLPLSSPSPLPLSSLHPLTPSPHSSPSTPCSSYQITSRVFFGEPGPWFNKMQMDGDKTTIFHDVDGSVSEYPGAFLVKEDNWLLRHPDCIDVPDWRAAICSGHYAQIYIQTRNPASLNMQMVKDEYPDRPLTLEGALGKRKHYQQFQPVVTLGKGYTVHWDQAAPAEITVWLINFNRNDWINVGFCYPTGTTFTIISDIHNRLTKQTRKTGVFMRTTQRDKINQSHLSRGYYYWEEDTGLLFLRVKAHNEKEDFAFCSVKGCERVKITAVIPKGSSPSDCMTQAYPLHAEMPIVDVPMPRKLPSAKLRTTDHFLEVKLESYNTRFFHIKEDFAYTEVNGRKLYQPDDGVQLTVMDGHDGRLVESKGFRNSILQGVPAQIESYVNNLTDFSIVIITSKGRLVTRGPWTRILELLGADKTLKLRDKLTFVGFKGTFRPDWIRMEVDEERAKIHQVLPIPVVKKIKL